MKKPLRAIFHGLRHEHAPGKLSTLAKLRDDFEIVAAVDDRVCSRCPGGLLHRRLRIDGTNGTIELEPIERFDGRPLRLELFLRDPAGTYAAGRHDLEFGPQTDRYAGQFLELAAIVRGEKPNPVELYDHDLRVHDACLRACGLR